LHGSNEGGRCTRACTEITDRERRGLTNLGEPIGRNEQAVGQKGNVEDLLTVGSLLLGEQIEQKSPETTTVKR
jgi:hypothetical protein